MNNIQAVILDWAGTVVDFGSVAPTSIFVEAFQRAYDFEISLEEARKPMGLGKWAHIKTLGELPEVESRWREQFGQSMDEKTIDTIYETFMPLQKKKVADFAKPIPGVLDVINWLKSQGVKIGSCSGYPQEVMEVLVEASERHGYVPDCWVASDSIPAGSRPGPWMALQNVIELGVSNVAACIKFDDSEPGIREGANAGMWTVAIALTGNAVGLSGAEWGELSSLEQEKLAIKARFELAQSGAHYVIDSLADALPVIQDISSRIARGERP